MSFETIHSQLPWKFIQVICSTMRYLHTYLSTYLNLTKSLWKNILILLCVCVCVMSPSGVWRAAVVCIRLLCNYHTLCAGHTVYTGTYTHTNTFNNLNTNSIKRRKLTKAIQFPASTALQSPTGSHFYINPYPS